MDSSTRSDSARWLKRVENVSTLGLHWWDAVKTKDKSPHHLYILSLRSHKHLLLWDALSAGNERHVKVWRCEIRISYHRRNTLVNHSMKSIPIHFETEEH